MSCSHWERSFLRVFGFTQHAHFQTSNSLSHGIHVAQHATLSHRSHQSVRVFGCSLHQNRSTSQQPDPHTPPEQPAIPLQQQGQLSIPELSGRRLHLAQQCLLIVLHGLNIIDFKHPCCSLDTPLLSCTTVLNVSVAGFVSPSLPQPMTYSQVSPPCPRQLV